MNVLHVPDVRDANPYQQRLADALADRGVEATFASSHLTPLTRVLPPGRRPDVLHLHWPHPFLVGRTRATTRARVTAVPRVLRAVQRLGVPVVWTVHNLLAHASPAPDLEARGRRRLARLADAVLVHCPAARVLAAEAWDLPRDATAGFRVVPHGPYDPPADPPAREDARARLDLGDADRVLLHLGKLRAYKGVPDLLDAFRRVDAPGARLVVAGAPETPALARELRRAAGEDDRVRLHLGFVPEAHVPTYFAAADAAVLPYRKVLTSGSLHLAAAHATPVVAPERGCLPFDLEDADDLTYDPTDDRGLEAALRRALEEDLEDLPQRTREAAARRSWGKVAGTLEEVYEDVRRTSGR